VVSVLRDSTISVGVFVLCVRFCSSRTYDGLQETYDALLDAEVYNTAVQVSCILRFRRIVIIIIIIIFIIVVVDLWLVVSIYSNFSLCGCSVKHRGGCLFVFMYASTYASTFIVFASEQCAPVYMCIHGYTCVHVNMWIHVSIFRLV
jgi:hypothetical protein